MKTKADNNALPYRIENDNLERWLTSEEICSDTSEGRENLWLQYFNT